MSTSWHENVMLTCPRPGDYHGGSDNAIRSELNNRFIPCTWNGCCSPECGNWIEGYLDAASDDDPIRRHWEWNRAAAQQMCDDYDRMVEACEHSWSLTDGHCRTFEWGDYTGETTKYYQLLKCDHCDAPKQGEPIASPYGVPA